MYTLKAVLVHLLNLWLTIFNDFFYSIGHEIGEQFDSSLPDVEQLKPPGSFKSPEIIIELMPNEINT